MSANTTDTIVKKLDELIELVKKGNNVPKVENHTHHHYPTYPTYNYPTTYPGWTQGTSPITTAPGSTWTYSTNDPPTANGPVNT